MLQKIRDHAGSWFIKLLFVFLVLSFSLWGIGDVLRNYSHSRPLLTVGSFTVSLEEFTRTLRQTQSNIQSSASKPLTPEQIKQLDLVNRILEQFTTQGLVRQEVNAAKLVVTDATIKAKLHSIPAFHDDKHIFNPEYFRRVLQHNHISEAKFINDLRLDLLQAQLLQPLTRAQYLPQSYTKILFRGINQSYSFNIVEIPFNKIPLPSAPDEATLKVFYEQNRDKFSRPEARLVSLLVLDLEHLKKAIPLSDERLRAEYEQRTDDFVIPERRSIEELIVHNEYADEALERLQKGQSMSSVASLFKADRRDVVEVTRGELSQDVADTVFADKPVPFVTTPIKTSLGTQIIVVSKIKPQTTRPFDEVRAELVTALRETIANEQYRDLYTKIEDNLAGGATLESVAKENGLLFVQLASLTAQGNVTGGEFPGSWSKDTRQKATELAFATTEGADAPLTEIANSSSSFIVHVDKVIPAHVPDFANLRAEVTTEWQHSKRMEAAASIADSLVKAGSSHDFEQQAKRVGFKIQNLAISRAAIEKDAVRRKRFTEALWRDMFSLHPGKAIAGINKESFVVGLLVAIKPYDMQHSHKQYEAFEKLIQKTVGGDIEASFVNGLRNSYSVEVNASMLATATAGETQ
ncbi:MAG: SurA N-terminal domain-containing protein [Alphaproteobacteria bacterium]